MREFFNLISEYATNHFLYSDIHISLPGSDASHVRKRGRV